MQKILSRVLLAVYLLILIWLVLFKFSFNPETILHHDIGLNLIPFADSWHKNGGFNFSEVILNCVCFIPLGLLLNMNFKKTEFKWKLAWIIAFSLAIEVIQYAFAIGVSDITDIVTNSAGGSIGLAIYSVGKKSMTNKNLDRAIISLGVILLLLFVVSVGRLFLRRMG